MKICGALIGQTSRLRYVPLAAGLLLVATALADTHYVDIKSSNPVAPYTSWETAANRIHAAVDAARNKDTVLIGDGTYDITEQIRIQKGLTVRSVNGPETTVVDANHKCRVFNLKSDNGSITLEGLTISGGYSHENGGAVVVSSGGSGIFDCIIENSVALKFGGGIYIKADEAVIELCSIQNNRSENRGGGVFAHTRGKDSSDCIRIADCLVQGNWSRKPGGGLWCDGVVVISKCRILNNSAEKGGGILLNTGAVVSDSLIVGNVARSGGGGGVCSESIEDTGNSVINCTVAQNQSPTYGGGVHKADVYNSIIVNNSSGGTPEIGEGCRVFNSCSSEPSSSRTGNIKGRPRFVNARKGDFRLLPGSPCIDVGLNRHTTQSTDLDGNLRIVDGSRDGEAVVDMGAYEFQVIAVEIDIKPGSKSNAINLKAGGLLPVAILTTETFDAASVNPSTVRFADAKPERRMLQDVDADGDVDLLLQFKRQKLNLTADSTKAFLTGQTRDKHPFIGMAEIKVVPQK